MGSGHLFGWESVGEDWVKVACNPSGELQIDASLILEDVPTDGELEKAPTSNWAYNHKADVAAHHAKYTDVESRTAIDDIFTAGGVLTRNMDFNYKEFVNVARFNLKAAAGHTHRVILGLGSNSKDFNIFSYEGGVGWSDFSIYKYNGSAYIPVIDSDNFQATLDDYLEEAPSDGVVNKAPTSNWAYDHNANASAHHAKFTALEAQEACNLDGDLYHSFPGTAFKPTNPDTDQHHYAVSGKLISDQDGMSVYAPVMLPDGCTVTACLVDGSAGLTDEGWTLWRITHSDQVTAIMGQAVVQTEDTSIANPVIDNSLYSYHISLTAMDTADELYYTRIKYTL